MALKHVVGSAKNGFTSIVEHIEHAIIAGVLLAAITVAVIHGFEKGSSLAMRLVFAMVLVAAVAMEFRACRRMVIEFYQRNLASSLGWCMLWIVCAIGTLYTSFATAAKNIDEVSAIHKAAFNTYGDVRKEREDAEQEWKNAMTATKQVRDRKYTPLPQVAGKPVETVAAADALIKSGMADGFYARTNNCTEAKGKQASAHCNALAEAIAAKSALEARAKIDVDLVAAMKAEAEAKSDFEVAKAKVANTDTRVSDDMPHLKVLAATFGLSERNARIADGMQMTGLMQALLSLAAFLLAIEHCRTLPRRKWLDWSAMWNGSETPANPASHTPAATPLLPHVDHMAIKVGAPKFQTT